MDTIISTCTAYNDRYDAFTGTSDSIRSKPIIAGYCPNSNSNSCYDNKNNKDIIEIRCSCLLIPIVIAIWWLYTRRMAQRCCRVATLEDDLEQSESIDIDIDNNIYVNVIDREFIDVENSAKLSAKINTIPTTTKIRNDSNLSLPTTVNTMLLSSTKSSNTSSTFGDTCNYNATSTSSSTSTNINSSIFTGSSNNNSKSSLSLPLSGGVEVVAVKYNDSDNKNDSNTDATCNNSDDKSDNLVSTMMYYYVLEDKQQQQRQQKVQDEKKLSRTTAAATTIVLSDNNDKNDIDIELQI